MSDIPSVPAHLDQPALRPLWQAVHDRLSSGRSVSRVRLGPLDDDQREALADLLGLDRLPDARPTIPLARLDAVLGEACGQGVREVVTTLLGPVGDRARERELRETERTALWDWLKSHEAVRSQPALAEWVTHLRGQGLIGGSVDRTRSTLNRALTVLAALPAAGEPLPSFAARVLHGDPHALDDGTRLSALVLRALTTQYGTAMPDGAESRRALWARAGIADDDLSTTVLVAGLRPLSNSGGTAGRLATICADAGMGVSLTLAQLRVAGDVQLTTDVVHVTENPSVLALALQRFGTRCPTLVCTSGWPNSAVILLLRHLASAGVSLRYHGDFDGEGIRIAAYVLSKTSARPWRMLATDYLAAATAATAGPELGRLTPAPWDPDLVGAMTEQGIAVAEETVAPALLDDLSKFVS